MKVIRGEKRNRGRPKGSRNKNRRKKNPLPTNTTTATTTTTTTIVENKAGSVIICSDSNSSPTKSIIDVVSLSDTIVTDVSESSCIVQRKVSDAKSVDLKEARVVLQNIIHSKLISPKQRTELLNKSYNSENSTPLSTPSAPKKKKQKKKKSKAVSISSATSGSSVIFVGKSIPIVPDSKFYPKISLEKIKVESPQKIPEIKTCKRRASVDKSLEKQSLDKKATHPQKKSESGISNARKSASTDKPVSIHGSSSSEQLELEKPKKDSRGTKRKRSETSFEGNVSSLEGSAKKDKSRVKKSAKRRRKNSSEVKGKLVTSSSQNSSNEGSKSTPKKKDASKSPLKNVEGILQSEKSPPPPNIMVNIQHINNFCTFGVNDLTNGNYSQEPPILSPKITGVATPLACHNREQVEIRANDHATVAVCINRTEVEIRTDEKLTQTSFATNETDVGLDLDEKHCCLDSIAQAIANDLAAGNRLSPLGDIETMGMPADLATDTCCLRKMMISDSAPADNPETLEQDKEKSRNVSGRSSDSHETSSNISSSTGASGSNRKRKRPAIIKDDILPKGTISVSPRNAKKKQRMASSNVASETTVTDEKVNQNLSANSNNGEYIFINQSDVNLPTSLQAWSKCSEIAPLLEENTANDRLSEKHDCIIDDALNNNQDVNIANKNTLNSEKQEEKITLYTSDSVVSPDFEEEFDALRGLLTTISDPNDPNSIPEVDGCAELENNHPNSLNEVDNYPEFGSNVPSIINEIDSNLELEHDDREVDEAIESFTASVNSSRMKNNREKENVNQVASLTVDNVDKFDCAAGGSAAAKIVSRSQSFETESSRDWQSEDVTECGSVTKKVRRRRWVTSEDIKSTPAPRQKIRLNRGNWSTETRERSGLPSAAGDNATQAKNSLVTSKNAVQDPNKNDNKIEYSQKVIAQTVTNNHFRKPSSPAKYAQKRDNVAPKAVPGFGEGALYGVPASTSETDGNSDDSSGSSSSSSSSDSSSSSSSSSDSDSSDDEDATTKVTDKVTEKVTDKVTNKVTEKVTDKVTEKIPEKAAEKVDENFFQRIPKKITNKDPRTLPSRVEKPEIPGPSVSRINPREIRNTKEDKAQLVLEKVEENGNAAGSFSDAEYKDKKDEDQDDCISLFADSICMSMRCESPPLNESPKRRRSPLYKQMKSSNIDSFANGNKTQCDADIAAYKEKVNNDKDDKKQQQNKIEPKTANEPRPNLNSMPILDPRNETQSRPVAQTENKVDLRSTMKVRCEQEPKYFFFGQCYAWLKFGNCNQSACRYSHVLKPQLQRIGSYQLKIIEGILAYATANRYCYFIEIVLSQVVVAMSTEQIIRLYEYIYMSQLLTEKMIESTTEALIQRGMSLKEIATTLCNRIVNTDGVTPNAIIRAVLPKIKEQGTLWETLGKVISKISPPVGMVETLIEECINENKSTEHLYDVYENLIKNLPVDFLPNIRDDLLKRFHEYLKNRVSLNASAVENNVEPQHVTQQNDVVACSIASPDSITHSVDHTLPEKLAEVGKSMTALTSTPNAKKSKSATISASQRSSTSSRTSGYSMAPIDNLPAPKSPYRDVLWKFHWDLQGVQEGLKHRDYTHVISILTQNMQHPSRLPHMEGFYNILCNEIMSSKHHLAEIVRLTVQSGASNDLRQFVFDLGVHVLTKLADIGAWVLAHELLKTFQVYGTYNTCAYTLLAVEIYIANYRPVKALELLKRSQLIFTNTKVWNQMRCPNDEPLRVTVMELLLGSLCDGHAQHALSLLEFILGDQCSSFKPINVSRYVDKIARALLAEKHTSSIIDFGRVVLQANLSPTRSTFRALINSIFHNDRILAKQLHRYATWLGAYNTAKISRTTHMVINNDWTEEEMFLMFSSLIKDLSTNIGHAIGRLRPRQLAVFLILETIPTERNLCVDICIGPSTNTAMNKRKAIVRNVLEHFDPKIKLVQKSQGRLCKVQSTSLVDYLKAGHFDH